MKFIYGYKTRENVSCTGEIAASSRSEVYALLKKQGIRPFKVDLAPGLGNYIQSFGKRWLAIGVLGVVCIVLGFFYFRASKDLSDFSLLSNLDDPTRRQLIGDAAVIDQGIRTGWADVFELEGDRFLASFAIPGVPAAVRSTTEEKIRETLDRSGSDRRPSAKSLEARQIFAIVEGMKQELREFLADGGSIAEYGQELVRRQEVELMYYNRAKTELESAIADGNGAYAEVDAMLTRLNSDLRKMGIRLLTFPENAKKAPAQKK